MSNKNRTLIKLDDKIIEITQGAKGLQAKELTADELVEVSLLDEGVEELIKNDINRLTNEAYAELKQNFKNTLKANVLKIAGFDDHWGHGWEVDHCNGRQSMMTDYISRKVQQMITQEADKLLQPEIEALLKPAKKALAKDFEDNFKREVRNQIREAAAKSAAGFVKDIVSKSMNKFQKVAIKEAEVAFLGRMARPSDEE